MGVVGMFRLAWARLRVEGRDALELVLLPGLAAVLPWRVCFFLFRWLAHWKLLYRSSCERAIEQARQRGWVQDEVQWLHARRLMILVDHADLYLARFRGDAWMKRHLRVQGQWLPADQAAVLCTFHWGAGMWGLRHAGAEGLKGHALVAPFDRSHFQGRWVLYRYAKARIDSVAAALNSDTLDVSRSLRPALRALRAHEQVLAAVDVPADQFAASEAITLLGMQARVPKALLRLAVEQRLPVVVYLTGVDLRSGERFLSIRQLGVHDTLEPLIRDVFLELDAAIRACPPAWHFWGESERFFQE